MGEIKTYLTVNTVLVTKENFTTVVTISCEGLKVT